MNNTSILPYVCSVCPKTFKYVRFLRNHLKIHFKGKGKENCNCLFNRCWGTKEEIIVAGSEKKVKCDLSNACANVIVVYIIGKIDNINFYPFSNVGKQ